MRHLAMACGGLILGWGATSVAAQERPLSPVKPSPAQMAEVARSIMQQVQPCADRQVTPGPSAERIVVTMALRLNRDGSLASAPRIVGHGGVDSANERYVARVDAATIASFQECAPLRGLPAELYDAPGGWSHVMMRYKLPG